MRKLVLGLFVAASLIIGLQPPVERAGAAAAPGTCGSAASAVALAADAQQWADHAQ